MGIPQFIELLGLMLKFPETLLEVGRMFKNTPQEDREKLLKRIRVESTHFEETGRPEWDD